MTDTPTTDAPNITAADDLPSTPMFIRTLSAVSSTPETHEHGDDNVSDYLSEYSEDSGSTTTDSSVSIPSVLTTPQRKEVKPTHSPSTNDKAILHLEESILCAQQNEQTHQAQMAAKLRALNKQLQEL